MVVIAIMAVLMAMLFSSIATSRERAYKAVCASQLSQIGKTYIKYQSLENGSMPVFNWMNDASMASVYLCPKDDNPTTVEYYFTNNSELLDVSTSYGFNLSASSQLVTTIDDPSEFVLSFDSDDLYSNEVEAEKVKNNNGHGNNVDGQDYSNTGNKTFTEIDSDNDDETKGVPDEDNWQAILGGLNADDVDNWYTNNLRFRHYGWANQLYLDGRVVGVRTADDAEKILLPQ